MVLQEEEENEFQSQMALSIAQALFSTMIKESNQSLFFSETRAKAAGSECGMEHFRREGA